MRETAGFSGLRLLMGVRITHYVMLAKVANKDTQTVVSALIKKAKKVPSELYKSLT
jgi:IS30 family transposase